MLFLVNFLSEFTNGMYGEDAKWMVGLVDGGPGWCLVVDLVGAGGSGGPGWWVT